MFSDFICFGRVYFDLVMGLHRYYSAVLMLGLTPSLFDIPLAIEEEILSGKEVHEFCGHHE